MPRLALVIRNPIGQPASMPVVVQELAYQAVPRLHLLLLVICQVHCLPAAGTAK